MASSGGATAVATDTAILNHRRISPAIASACVEEIVKLRPIEGVRLFWPEHITGLQNVPGPCLFGETWNLRPDAGLRALTFSHAADLALPNLVSCAGKRLEQVERDSL